MASEYSWKTISFSWNTHLRTRTIKPKWAVHNDEWAELHDFPVFPIKSVIDTMAKVKWKCIDCIHVRDWRPEEQRIWIGKVEDYVCVNAPLNSREDVVDHWGERSPVTWEVVKVIEKGDYDELLEMDIPDTIERQLIDSTLDFEDCHALREIWVECEDFRKKK